MKKLYLVFVTLFLTFCIYFTANAQPGFDDEPIDAPLDSDIVFLILTAALYGSIAITKKINLKREINKPSIN
ncbi:MAG: hypothetical protein H7296_05570 [Bacteroidia bacterium]|nr:hypothetical protein [Bacteroidia bacterium]